MMPDTRVGKLLITFMVIALLGLVLTAHASGRSLLFLSETPTELSPTDPSPTDPSPTEPSPTEPTLTEPSPTDPSPTEPTLTDPSPTDASPTDPSPTEPTLTDPSPTEPSLTEPTLLEPLSLDNVNDDNANDDPDQIICDFEVDLTGQLDANQNYSVGVVTNLSPACDYAIGMASYKMFDNVIDNQEIFNHMMVTIAAGATIQLSVAAPDCAYQSDLFFGDVLPSLNGMRYAERLLDGKQVVTNDNFCRTEAPTEPSPTEPTPTEPTPTEPTPTEPSPTEPSPTEPTPTEPTPTPTEPTPTPTDTFSCCERDIKIKTVKVVPKNTTQGAGVITVHIDFDFEIEWACDVVENQKCNAFYEIVLENSNWEHQVGGVWLPLPAAAVRESIITASPLSVACDGKTHTGMWGYSYLAFITTANPIRNTSLIFDWDVPAMKGASYHAEYMVTGVSRTTGTKPPRVMGTQPKKK